MPEPVVAIVGGGCSGVLTAAHLIESHPDISLVLLEPRDALGRGVAYSTPWPQHLLNVPAGQMSAFATRPDHFVEWLVRKGVPGGATAFVPRQIYGRYLQGVLEDAVAGSNGRARITHVRAEAMDLDLTPSDVAIRLSDGSIIRASQAVLALGNPAPADLRVLSALSRDPRVFASAWDAEALRLHSPNERVLLVGSGLTAVDALLAFEAQGHRGPLHLLSRRGRLPQAHRPDARPPAPSSALAPSTLRSVYRATRSAIGMSSDWREVVDGLRRSTNPLWESWSAQDRSRFLRHVKVHWDSHRHRMAPEIHATLEACRREGRLLVHAGRIRAVTASAAGVRVDLVTRHQEATSLEVDRVINCTGIAESYEGSRRPLIRALLAKRLARANPMGTGFSTDADGALIDDAGRASDRVFTIGPPRYGDLLETIAVPEIRVQAQGLAERLVESMRALEFAEVANP